MQKLSMRKYAEMIGVSVNAVSKAVKENKIVKGYDNETKKIIVDVANDEWGTGVMVRNLKGIEENKFTNETSPRLKRMKYSAIDESINFNEARRLKEVYNAEIARLASMKENGQLIDKSAVNAELFNFAKEFRIRLLAVPDRTIDNILAAKSRVEAHGIMLDELHNILENFCNEVDRAIKKDYTTTTAEQIS